MIVWLAFASNRLVLLVVQVLEYLIQHKLINMSGAGQKIVFNLLEQVLTQGKWVYHYF